jgi:hypothetical protein
MTLQLARRFRLPSECVASPQYPGCGIYPPQLCRLTEYRAPRAEETTMQKQVIEHDGIPVGIAVPHEDMLRFIAVKFHVIDLDERRYRSVGELKQAIRDHLNMPQQLVA